MSDTDPTTAPAGSDPSPHERWRRETAGRESIVLPSGLRHPPLRATVESLTLHFERGAPVAPLRNPHHENQVADADRQNATPAAVLIPILDREDGPTVVVTERHESISYGGHFCFPGGRRDDTDDSAWANALRETHEEVGIEPDRIRLLGRLGDYVTHSGFCISPFVGLVDQPVTFVPNPGEVEAVVEIPLAHVLRSDSYELRGWEGSDHAHYLLRHGEVMVAGPTVSMLIGLYESLVETHDPL
jgi:8-oxo-dGTP pyrophosphatase MutT (NUDIX family)